MVAPVKNFRQSTVLSTMATRSKQPSLRVSTAMVDKSSLPATEDHYEADKENIAPTNISLSHYTKSIPAKTAVKRDWDDLDAEDAEDPLMVSEYVVEIFDYMRSLEVALLVGGFLFIYTISCL